MIPAGRPAWLGTAVPVGRLGYAAELNPGPRSCQSLTNRSDRWRTFLAQPPNRWSVEPLPRSSLASRRGVSPASGSRVPVATLVGICGGSKPSLWPTWRVTGVARGGAASGSARIVGRVIDVSAGGRQTAPRT
jgi:hypothetical protein